MSAFLLSLRFGFFTMTRMGTRGTPGMLKTPGIGFVVSQHVEEYNWR